MSRYLIARGIDEHRIWKEETSVNTRENLIFSAELMKDKGLFRKYSNHNGFKRLACKTMQPIGFICFQKLIKQ